MTTRPCWFKFWPNIHDRTAYEWRPGEFHGWAQDNIDHGETGPGHYPCAIIEDESGQVRSVYVECVNFGPTKPKG